ncbi:MAG: hypothetical protein LBK61_14115 [Spirochaetaceae bacterium]|jgi:hypothetical protein|nr:hypothetical protein [Spirochaetaceae bacterium]
MKKCVCSAVMLSVIAVFVWAQQSRNETSDRGYFIDAGILYNYEKIGADPKIENTGISYLLGLGYDLGDVNIHLFFSPMLSTEVTHSGDEYGEGGDVMDVYNLGVGFNIGIKLINSNTFDMTLPVGILFRSSTLKMEQGGERDFVYKYLNIEWGLVLSWAFESITLLVPFYVGYPISKTNEVTNYAQKDFAVTHYNVGLSMRRTF